MNQINSNQNHHIENIKNELSLVDKIKLCESDKISLEIPLIHKEKEVYGCPVILTVANKSYCEFIDINVMFEKETKTNGTDKNSVFYFKCKKRYL